MRASGATCLTLLGVAAALATGATAATASAATDHVTIGSCRAANVTVTLNAQGATQSLLGSIFVANRGPTACRLSGRPAITVRGGSPGERVVERAAKPLIEVPGKHYVALTLSARHTATAQFQWTNWCDPASPPRDGKRPSGIFVTLAPASAPIRITPESGSLSYLPVCNAPQDPSTISVSLWQPFTPS
ncbi:MAG: DUF4232 domain-containing protein [Solirubrobacteraceae bacterium]